MKTITLSIDIKTPKTLPIAHAHILQGIVYELLSGAPVISEYIHDRGYVHNNRRYKLFTFGRLVGDKRVEGKTISYSGIVSFEIRSVFDDIIETIADTLRERRIVYLAGTPCPVFGYSIAQNEMFGDTAIIRMITPICVHRTEGAKTIYFSPDNPDFLSLLDMNFRHKYTSYYGLEPDSGIGLVPIKLSANSKCVTKFKNIYVTAYYGEYQLSAREDYMKFLYHTGIGSKNSQGFGMFEFI